MTSQGSRAEERREVVWVAHPCHRQPMANLERESSQPLVSWSALAEKPFGSEDENRQDAKERQERLEIPFGSWRLGGWLNGIGPYTGADVCTGGRGA